MALNDTYTLAFLSDLLPPIGQCQIHLRRFDEQSGSGDGRFWTAQLARPLWEVNLTLSPRSRARATEVGAKVRALDGTRRSFMFRDRAYASATGAAAGSGATVQSISADRGSIAIAGLPAGYTVSAGDKLSIVHGSNRYYFGEFVETFSASGGGVTAPIAIMPYLPLGVTVGASVELDRPRLKVICPPGGFTPFTDIPGRLSQGAALNLLQDP